MANKSLFNSTPGKLLPKTDCINEAMGKAYAFSTKHQLAQGELNAEHWVQEIEKTKL